MKNLFISLAVLSISSAVSVTANGQTNVNLEKLNQKPAKFSLKFIDDIELLPETRSTSTIEATTDKVEKTPVEETATENPSEERSSSIEKCEAWQFKYAMMLNVEVEKMTNRKLYSFIDEWWATRYLYGGTTKRGIDCSAFTGALANDVFGIKLPRTAREQ
jgi:lipoprotein Spr